MIPLEISCSKAIISTILSLFVYLSYSIIQRRFRTPLDKQRHSDYGKQRVVGDQFEADMVVVLIRDETLQGDRQQRSRESHQRNPAVTNPPPGADAECEHSQNRPVRITRNLENQVNHTVITEPAEKRTTHPITSAITTCTPIRTCVNRPSPQRFGPRKISTVNEVVNAVMAAPADE